VHISLQEGPRRARHTHRHSPLSRVATCRALTKRHFLLLSPRRTKERDSYENAETRRQRSFKAPALSIPLLRVAPAKPWSETHCTDSRSPRRPKGNSLMAITEPAASQATRVSRPRHVRRPSPASGVAKCQTMVPESPYAPDSPRRTKESGTRNFTPGRPASVFKSWLLNDWNIAIRTFSRVHGALTTNAAIAPVVRITTAVVVNAKTPDRIRRPDPRPSAPSGAS
jgi:hypothetical protein